MTLAQILGYAAAILLIASFAMQTLVWLRYLAIAFAVVLGLYGIVAGALRRAGDRHRSFSPSMSGGSGKSSALAAPHGPRRPGQGRRSRSTGCCRTWIRWRCPRTTCFSTRAIPPTRCTSSRRGGSGSRSSASRSARAACSARWASSPSRTSAPRRRCASRTARCFGSRPSGCASCSTRTRNSASSWSASSRGA